MIGFYPIMPPTPPQKPEQSPPPELADDESGEYERVQRWRVERFEVLGWAYPWALELARNNVNWHEAAFLLEAMHGKGYEDAVALELAAEILLP